MTGTVVEHLGNLHGAETWLVAGIALGPFLVLAAVVYVVRRRDLAGEDETDRPGGVGDDRG